MGQAASPSVPPSWLWGSKTTNKKNRPLHLNTSPPKERFKKHQSMGFLSEFYSTAIAFYHDFHNIEKNNTESK